MRLPDEVLLDVLHHLDRETLDSIGITSRQYHAVAWKGMSTVCLRRIRNVYLTYDGVTVAHLLAAKEETKFPGQFNLGLCLRSSCCRFISLQFDWSKGERHLEEVMQDLQENASTIAAREVFFRHEILTRSGLALTKRLVESLAGIRHVDYGTCFRVTFPDVSFEKALRDLEARQETTNRVMDDEISLVFGSFANDSFRWLNGSDPPKQLPFEMLTAPIPVLTERNLTCTQNDRFPVYMRLNGDLPEEFELRIISPYNNPEQDLGNFETVLEQRGYCRIFLIKGTDLKLRQDGDDERDYRDASIYNYSYSEEKYATDDE
ncbi:hypothetical protein AAVH_29062 [Aphelenchoides avenae]|nr:hypothetical protein AAVH_29062 [Aphelenchus avenae]